MRFWSAVSRLERWSTGARRQGKTGYRGRGCEQEGRTTHPAKPTLLGLTTEKHPALEILAMPTAASRKGTGHRPDIKEQPTSKRSRRHYWGLTERTGEYMPWMPVVCPQEGGGMRRVKCIECGETDQTAFSMGTKLTSKNRPAYCMACGQAIKDAQCRRYGKGVCGRGLAKKTLEVRARKDIRPYEELGVAPLSRPADDILEDLISHPRIA